MAITYNRLIIDVNKDINDIVTAKQDDAASRFLDVSLIDNGTPIDLTGHSVKIYFKKYDSMEVYTEGEITDPTAGRCQFELTSQTLSAVGHMLAEISIFDGTASILSTRTFTINVLALLRDDDAPPSTNEYGVLVTLFQNIQSSLNTMNDVLAGFDSLEVSTEAAHTAADNATAVGNTINGKIGTSTGTVFEKLQAAIADIASLRAYVATRSGVKSVQRGVTKATSINISTVNPLKCQVTLYNSELFGLHENYSSGGAVDSARYYGAIVQSLTSNTLTITQNWADNGSFGVGSGGSASDVSWEIVEYN